MQNEFEEPSENELLMPIPYEPPQSIAINDPARVERLELLIQEWLLEKYRQTRSVKTRQS